MSRKLALLGRRFGRLVVVGETRADDARRRVKWICQCDCGNITAVVGHVLIRGESSSCGCYRASANGHHGSPTYIIWTGMVGRCTSSKNSAYRHYGKRGIKVCDRWLRYENFLADMGERPPGMQIDRIDNDGNYEPANCRWVTQQENLRKTRRSRYLDVRGETLTLAETAERFGLPVGRLWRRLDLGWSVEEAISGARVSA